MRLTEAVVRSVDAGLLAAALVDRDGDTVALAGEITVEEAMPLAAMVMFKRKSADLAPRLFAGEVLVLELEDRYVAVGVAKKQLFVVAVIGRANPERQNLACLLRDEIEELIPDTRGEMTAPPPWATGGGGGSSSGPAELQVVEYGITVGRRARAKA
jgi:hypothetical protein